MKSEAVVIEIGDENILHLEEPARMKKRQRIAKTFERARNSCENGNRWARPREFLRVVRDVSPAGKVNVRQILDADEAIFEANGFPDVLPEGNAAAAVTGEFRASLEQTANRGAELRGRDVARFRDSCGFFAGDVRAHLNKIEAAIAARELFVGQVVVDIREVDMKNLVAKERESLPGIERIEDDEAAEIEVFLKAGRERSSVASE